MYGPNIQRPPRNIGSTHVEPRMQAFVRANAPIAGTKVQAITNGTPTAINWEVALFDRVGLWNATNPSRLTIPNYGPKVTGLWVFHGGIQWAPNSTGTRNLYIDRSVGPTGAEPIVFAPGFSGVAYTMQITLFVEDPDPGEFFELIALQDSGASLNVNLITSAVEVFSWFEVHHLW